MVTSLRNSLSVIMGVVAAITLGATVAYPVWGDTLNEQLIVRQGQSGATPHNFAVIAADKNDHAMMSVLTPASKTGWYGFGDPTDSYVGGISYNHALDQLSFAANNADRLVISSDGNIGIGTAKPKARLHVATGLAVGHPNAISDVHGGRTSIQLATDTAYGGIKDTTPEL